MVRFQLSDDVKHFYVTYTVDLLSVTENNLYYTLFYPWKGPEWVKRSTVLLFPFFCFAEISAPPEDQAYCPERQHYLEQEKNKLSKSQNEPSALLKCKDHFSQNLTWSTRSTVGGHVNIWMFVPYFFAMFLPISTVYVLHWVILLCIMCSFTWGVCVYRIHMISGPGGTEAGLCRSVSLLPCSSLWPLTLNLWPLTPHHIRWQPNNRLTSGTAG